MGARDHQRAEPRASWRRAGIAATTIYNAFDPDPRPGTGRARVGRSVSTRARSLLLQPTRALERKNIAGALELTAAVGATYWLLGPAEDGYGPELDRLVARARCPVLLGQPPGGCSIADAYAASDAVLLPSFWEGFGNPSVESATYRRPLAIGPYPVAAELAAFGFRWFGVRTPRRSPDGWSAGTRTCWRTTSRWRPTHFNLADLPARLAGVLARAGISGGV